MKQCRLCNETKPASDFYANKKNRDRLHSYCKLCLNAKAAAWRVANPERARARDRDAARKRRVNSPGYYRESQLKCMYGITLAEYDVMLERQGGRCGICGQPPRKRRLSVDHDHVTKRIRGLLCNSCNRGLGHFKDDELLLCRAIDYLIS